MYTCTHSYRANEESAQIYAYKYINTYTHTKWTQIPSVFNCIHSRIIRPTNRIHQWNFLNLSVCCSHCDKKMSTMFVIFQVIPWFMMFYCTQNLQHSSFFAPLTTEHGNECPSPVRESTRLMKRLFLCLFRAVIVHMWLIFKYVYVRTTVGASKWLIYTFGTDPSGARCWINSIHL